MRLIRLGIQTLISKLYLDAAYHRQHILAVMDNYAPGFDRQKISVRDSSKGRWQSVTVTIIATGKPQLDDIFAALKTSASVKMVL